MAHPEMEASTPTNPGDALEDFADFLEATGVEDEDEDEELPDEGDEAEPVEGSDPEEDGEQDIPAIDPPVSWGTDAKEQFAQLPVELQTFVSEREAQRDKAVQRATTETAEAKRTALVEAQSVFADQQRQYASEIEFYASRIAPQPPSPELANTDPVRFIQLNAQYQAGMQQHNSMMQQAADARDDAVEREKFVAAQQHQAELAVLAQEIPEWSDEAKRHELLTNVASVGAELGYTPETLAEATAQDVMALRKAVEWKSKALKYDALQRTKMETVRKAKGLPKVVRPGVAPTRGEMSSNRAANAWQNVKAAKSKDAQASAFADFLETSGHI